jgi:nucleotide-binding universal stress UspA family protein
LYIVYKVNLIIFGGQFMAEKILLATDNSEQAEKAGEAAISMGSLGSTIIVLYVIDTDYLDALPQQDLRNQLEKNLREEGKKAVESFKEKLEEEQCAGKCKGVDLITVIKEGKPADVILKTAEEEGVDQILIGKSGKHGIEKFLLGSTADRVVRGAKVPVDVIS